jgi:GTP-dependent phosphoenolpyruvate carboxykinase
MLFTVELKKVSVNVLMKRSTSDTYWMGIEKAPEPRLSSYEGRHCFAENIADDSQEDS